MHYETTEPVKWMTMGHHAGNISEPHKDLPKIRASSLTSGKGSSAKFGYRPDPPKSNKEKRFEMGKRLGWVK